MSVAAIQPSALVYREEQNFDWRIYALLLVTEGLMALGLYCVYHFEPQAIWGDGPGPLVFGVSAAAGLAFPLVLMVGLLRMTTEVTPTDVRVWFGWVPTYRRLIPISGVQKIEVVTYRPLVDYGGWGIRMGRNGERVLNARGNRGVRLDLSDGTRLLIGSQRPEALAVAIERALRPGV